MTKPNIYKEALEGMVSQFSYRGTRGKRLHLNTGGLSALEYAFKVLGWDDPHFVDTENSCNIAGCYGWAVSGLNWGDLYLNLCSEHTQEAFKKLERPTVKRWALRREAKRDANGVLP